MEEVIFQDFCIFKFCYEFQFSTTFWQFWVTFILIFWQQISTIGQNKHGLLIEKSRVLCQIQIFFVVLISFTFCHFFAPLSSISDYRSPLLVKTYLAFRIEKSKTFCQIQFSSLLFSIFSHFLTLFGHSCSFWLQIANTVQNRFGLYNREM